MIKKLIVILILTVCFCPTVSAQTNEQKDFYVKQYETSGIKETEQYLPQEAREYLDENGVDFSNPDWVNTLTLPNVFEHIWDFLKAGAKTPFINGGGIIAIILISAALSSMENADNISATVMYATALSSAALISVPIFSVLNASINAMKGCTVFMLSFIPVFAVVTAAAGKAVTAVSMSSLLLGATQGVSFISNFVVMPLMSGYLAISFASSVSPLIARSGIADGIKKIAFWTMSLLTTVFIGILSIQTVVNSSADTLSLKTAKFIVGSSVPVAGTVLSEALTTVTASMGLLKSSVGIYGVIACCICFLPLLAELLLWRVVLLVCSSIADLFSTVKISALLKSVDTVISIMTGIILLTCAMFVISLTVVVTVGK